VQKATKSLFVLITSAVLTGVVFAVARKRIDPKGYTALFVGDSHTALYGKGWQDVLAKMYGFKVENIAKSGANTNQMLSSLKNYLDRNKTPDMLFIYGGANDIYSGKKSDTVFQNIQAMVDIGIDYGIPSKNIFVVSGYNTEKLTAGSKYAKGSFPKKMDAVKESFPSQIDRATIVPTWHEVSSKDTGDGLHLHSRSQARFAKYVGSKIFK